MLAEFANVQPRANDDCVQVYVTYVPLPPFAVVVNVTCCPTSTVAGEGVGMVNASAVNTVNGVDVCLAETTPLESVTVADTVYVVPAAVGLHMISAAFASVHPRLDDDSVQAYMVYVPLPPLAAVVKFTYCPTSVVDGEGTGEVTDGTVWTVSACDTCTGDTTPFESVTVTDTVYVVPAAVGLHMISAAFASVHPRLDDDSVHVYVVYVPLPPLAVVVKFTYCPRSMLGGLAAGTVTAGPLVTTKGDEVWLADVAP
jgi:hypothetical protein